MGASANALRGSEVYFDPLATLRVLEVIDTADRPGSAFAIGTYADAETYVHGGENKPGKRIPKAGAVARAGVGLACAEWSVCEAEAKGPNASAGAGASLTSGVKAFASAELASASATAGPLKAKVGLALDTGVGISPTHVEAKVLGTGFKKWAFLCLEVHLNLICGKHCFNAKGPNASAGVAASVMRTGAFARAELASASASAGPLRATLEKIQDVFSGDPGMLKMIDTYDRDAEAKGPNASAGAGASLTQGVKAFASAELASASASAGPVKAKVGLALDTGVGISPTCGGQSAGNRLLHCLSITNTMFKHKGVHQCTWHQDTLGRRSMIDFVVISSDLQPYVLDTRVKRGAELSTDHHLVVSWIRWQRRKLDRPGRPKRIVRVCWERLAEPSVREVFNSHLRKSFSQIPREAGDIESGVDHVLCLHCRRRQFEVVDARSLVPVVAATPNPVVDTGSKGCRQAEEGVLSGS
ncbi:hypothetical protein L3Q82_016222 [Scortum barcoo]|uniref:Uncharacterized protein n=1 Tax=Scortum barcoo TaxID=214431 RepID=A0ACB8VR01_9TELE|nr:hypothetical protein L3Q82_016222 [Scortum barcoo]